MNQTYKKTRPVPSPDSQNKQNDISPLDSTGIDATLDAFIIEDGERLRIHGFDVHEDLAHHYSFAEVILLTLCGTPPDEATGTAFAIALIAASPVPIAEAPTHAARIAHVCSADTAGIASLAAIALAEQARWLIDEHKELLLWLTTPSPPPLAPQFQAAQFQPENPSRTTAIRTQVRHLQNALPRPFRQDPIFHQDPTLWAAILTIFVRCGLHNPSHLLTTLLTARITSTIAEAMAGERGQLQSYPANLPQFIYKAPEQS